MVEAIDAERAVLTGSPGSPWSTRLQFRHWLSEARSSFVELPRGADYRARLESVRQLQATLYDAGWARIGWPEHLGGLGGDARHRAVINDELAAAGFSSRYALEHLEILAPALVAHWEPTQLQEMLPKLLRGDELWCQGFSEPDAGSDLVAMRTSATLDGDEYVIRGHKIWTSWALYAQRCVVLARTGTPSQRHRGLSVFFVDLGSTGIDVRPLRQANGLEELAEVSFDEVRVPRSALVGPEGGGWPVALDVLSCERSAFAWLRQARLHTRVEALARSADVGSADELGNVLVDLFAVRMASASAVNDLADGRFAGPAAASVNALLTDAEQHLYDLAHRLYGSDIALGARDDAGEMTEWQEEYLFSRAVSIYGGTRQMQLTTIARFLLELPTPERRA
jgi:alkylation response protein AidB-like acyl-CoA dehydrogenase